ncbi:hypothetical protein Tco_0772848 [Tanacetum coccineum]|uniref:Uncharacterized protein n=1 Tax=Tanacetum coccineum TaxID=301880 RepID=A0ABQ4ZK34_9ASTR
MLKKKLEVTRGVITLRVQNTKCKRKAPKRIEVQTLPREEKEEETEEYSIGWEIKERVCSHTQKAVTGVTTRKERNPFSENVTMKEHAHRGQKCSPKVKIAEGDTRSQNQKSKGQASRMTTYHNHGSDDLKDHLKIFQAVAKVER